MKKVDFQNKDNKIALITLIVVTILSVVIVKLATRSPKEDNRKEFPGKENTYRVVTLYDSRYGESAKMAAEISMLDTEYDNEIDFVYVNMLKEPEDAGNLKLMGGKSYTVYFLDKNNDVLTVWYDNNFKRDDFVAVIEQYFNKKPK